MERFHNQKHQTLFMDFGELYNWGIPVSDIDMIHYCKNGFLILGEIKNSIGTYTQEQRGMHEELVDNYSKGAILLYINHNQFVEEGSTKVDVSKCNVVEFYHNHQWSKVKEPITVLDAMLKLERMQQ